MMIGRKILACCTLLVGVQAVGCAKSGEEPGASGKPATALEAPSCKLDKETAKKLLLADTYEKGIAQCNWTGAYKSTERGHTFVDIDTTAKCASQLEAAGVVKRGECLEEGCGGCCKRIVLPAGTSDGKDRTIAFPCGKLTLLEVVSITTTESDSNKAEVAFRRRYEPDAALLGKVDLCTLNKPKEGEAQITWKFSRSDDGTWKVASR